MKHKKSFFIALLLLLLSASLLGYLNFNKNNKETPTPEAVVENNYLLKDYPSDVVPLYKMKMVSSAKFFVNDDPKNFAGYFGHPVNYYNVVFETEADPAAFLNYYKSLMSDVNEDSLSEERIEGVIGNYKVSASHYGNNPKNYGYLQVYLPADEYQEENRYYQDYPNVVDLGQSWVEYESSYGLLNQKGGEVEYTQYFPLPEEEEDQDALITEYKEKYQNETDYSFNEETGLMSWKKDVYSISMTFSKNHGRIYLMVRKPM